jgi:hypothetical protein
LNEYFFALTTSNNNTYTLEFWSTNDITESNAPWKRQKLLPVNADSSTNNYENCSITVGNGYIGIIATLGSVNTQYICYKRINVAPILPKISLSGDTVTWIKAKNL